MIFSLLSIESDKLIPHEGSGESDSPEPEPEPELNETGNDYFDDDGFSFDDSDGEIVAVTEKSLNGNANIKHFGMSDPDPPSFHGVEDHDDEDAPSDEIM